MKIMIDLRAKSSRKRGQPGELLTSHLRNTLEALLSIRDRIGRIPNLPANFWTWAALAALLHDAGKFPAGFQRMVGNTDEARKPWGERHEVLSLGFVELLLDHLPNEQRLWIGTAVAGHHRSFSCATGGELPRKTPLFNLYGLDQPADFLAKFTPADQSMLTELLSWLHTTATQFDLPCDNRTPQASVKEITTAAHLLFEKLYHRWSMALPPRDRAGRTAVLLLGAVTMADHLSSAHSPLHTRHPLTPDYPADLALRLATDGHSLRAQQTQAAGTSGNLLLRSWTGSGKTEAALLWAARQIADISRDTGATPRVFYLLPYLASINAMVQRLSIELRTEEGIGVAHSRAASYHLARSLDDECPDDDSPTNTDELAASAAKAHSRAEATKNFQELLRIGTPYQLLRGALAGPAHSSILADSANSVFILDELHAYDARRLGMILAMMRFWRELGGRVAVMSATLPAVLQRLVVDALGAPVEWVQPPGNLPVPVRHRLHTRQAHLTDANSIKEIKTQLTAGRSVLVVANNIRDALILYQALWRHCVNVHGEDSAFLLHSRYRRMDRNTIEKNIRDRFATNAKHHRPGLIVGTQALEVSLDLDLDLCHTSAADLEALLQRFGRVNRLGYRPPAPVIVHQPTYARRRDSGDELWADGVYEQEPTLRAWETLTQHEGQIIDERATTDWLDDIYNSAWGKRWQARVAWHQRKFERAFLYFSQPFHDRSQLAREFDQQFAGTEAILSTDRHQYEAALATAEGPAGRLLADDFLIPVPHWSTGLTRWEKRLKVRIIEGEYDEKLGLQSIETAPFGTYQPGEVL